MRGAGRMTQSNIQSSQDHETQNILRDILHTVALTSEPTQGLESVLGMARTLTRAQKAALFLFGDPQLVLRSGIEEDQLPDPDSVKQVAETLSPGMHTNPPLPNGLTLPAAHALFAPIWSQKILIGLFWLAFDQPVPQNITGLEVVLDGIAILAKQARTVARHEKITRNQYEFMRIVLHDLRSPLTSMQGFASMLESGTVGEINSQQSHFVSKILSGISQMASLVENVQDAGRYDPETGFYEMRRAMCDVTEIARKIVNSHLVPAEKQELTISVNFGENLPIINADATMIERAITNLIDNAIKYTPNGGKVEVAIRFDGESVIFAVSDTGLGISADHQKQLFEKHFRITRPEHRRIKGSGLGLFIVRSVAQRHGGRAWVESVDGKGSTFFFSIPLQGPNGSAPVL